MVSGLSCMENIGVQKMRVDATRPRGGDTDWAAAPPQFTIRQFVFGDAPRLVEIQEACRAVCKDTVALTAGFFHGPGFEDGRNIFCAVDATDVMIGYAAVCANALPAAFDGVLELWLDLRVDPAWYDADRVRDQLLSSVVARAHAIGAASSESGVALVATYFASGHASIDVLIERGFVQRGRTTTLQRDLSMPLMVTPVSQGVEVLPWRMDTELGQQDYLATYAAITGDLRWDTEALQRFMKSEFWAVGTTFTAFHEGDIVGSALVWYDPNLMVNKQLLGRIERIFVKPDWRGRGIVQRLLNEGAAYLRRRGMSAVTLIVDDEDCLCVEVYEGLGYHIVQETVTLGLLLE